MKQPKVEKDMHPEEGFNISAQEPNIAAMSESAAMAADFLKSLAHKNRLLILCRLAMGPCTVTEIEDMLSVRQSSVSQQLARLRLEGTVKTERQGKTVTYSLADERVIRMVGLLYEIFCSGNNEEK